MLSIKPQFANLILAGTKRVELRRAIPAQHVGTIAIYSSAPVQSIVALVDVKEIIEAAPTKLWNIAKAHGGGLTRAELLSYFESKSLGFALMLENVRIFEKPINPHKFFKTFTPPQSFKYLTEKEFQKMDKALQARSEN